MIYQLKKQNITPAGEEPTPTNSTISTNKFQRTSRKGIKSPEETCQTSEKSESVVPSLITPEEDIADRPKAISRTNRVNRELVRSPVEQTSVGKLKRTAIPAEQNSPTSQVKPFRRKVEESPSTQKKQDPNLAPRIIPKVQTQQKYSVKTQESKQEDKAAVLKKTGACGFVIARLLKENLKTTFSRLLQYKAAHRRKQLSESKCLLLCSIGLARRYELSCYSFAFERFKNMVKVVMQEEFNRSQQVAESNSTKARQNLINVLHFIQKQKQKEYFQAIKNKKKQFDHASQAAFRLLNGRQNRKLKEYFGIVKQKSVQIYQSKKSKLEEIVKAFNFCNKAHQSLAFKRIEIYANGTFKGVQQNKSLITPRKKMVSPPKLEPASPPSSAVLSPRQSELSKKFEKLKTQTQRLSSQFQTKSGNVQQKKDHYKIAIAQSKEKVESLKSDKVRMEKELTAKKMKNQSLKREAQSKRKSLNIDEMVVLPSDENGKETKQQEVLQKIYSQLYRLDDNDSSSRIQQIIQQNKIPSKGKQPIIQQWELIMTKIRLQKQIDAYEGTLLGAKNIKTQIHQSLNSAYEQNFLVQNMIRNFVKERYLWSQVEKFVAAVL